MLCLTPRKLTKEKKEIHLNFKEKSLLLDHHCIKSVRIWSYPGPYSGRMRENTNQNNFEYGHFTSSAFQRFSFQLPSFQKVEDW